MILATTLVVGACGDALESVGDVSRRFVEGETSTTTSEPEQQAPVLNLKGITGLIWANDTVGGNAELPPAALIRSVWLRGDGVTPFIQSSRQEIVAALPGIEFPRLMPSGATHVSSQLVFDIQTASLAVSTAAAFGLWASEPYAAPRSEAQLAVLRVGLRTFDVGADPEEIFSFRVTGGRELSWTDGDYVYQLFCRTGVSEEACFAMAESFTPLSVLAVIVPSPST